MNLLWFGSVFILFALLYAQRLNGELITLESGGVWTSPITYSFGRLDIEYNAYSQSGSQVYLCLEDESEYEQVLKTQFCGYILSAGQNYSSIFYSTQSSRKYIFIVNRESNNITFDISVKKVENHLTSNDIAIIPPGEIETFYFEFSNYKSLKLLSYSNTSIKINLMTSIDETKWNSEIIDMEPQIAEIISGSGSVHCRIECKHSDYCFVAYRSVNNKYDSTWTIPVGTILGVTIIIIIAILLVGRFVWLRSSKVEKELNSTSSASV